VKGILGDANLDGQVRILVQILESPSWRDLWESLELTVLKFADLGLDGAARDNVIWDTCQSEDVILLTANRNNDGPTSLEECIRQHNRPHCLPVFTFADAKKFQRSRRYAHRVVESLLEHLIDIENYRGVGRLYLP
jgi:hypothetical protein